VTRGGFEPSEVMDVAVKPTGFPEASFVVMTATPEAWRLKAAFRASLESGFVFGSSIYFRVVEILGYKNLRNPRFLGKLARHAEYWTNLQIWPLNHKI
jgi:hypothetical protein